MLSRYVRTLLSCALISTVVAFTHTLIIESWLNPPYAQPNGVRLPTGYFRPALYYFNKYYHGSDIGYYITTAPDNAAVIIALTVVLIIPYAFAYTFDADQTNSERPSAANTVSGRRSMLSWLQHIWMRTSDWLTIRHSSYAVFVSVACTLPAWQWRLIRPINDIINKYVDRNESLAPWVVQIVTVEFWRIQELWIFLIVPIILLPLVYRSKHAQPRYRYDNNLANLDLNNNHENVEDCSNELSFSLNTNASTLPTEKRSRCCYFNGLYILVLSFALLWWMIYLSEIIGHVALSFHKTFSIANTPFGAVVVYGQRLKVLIILVLTIIIAAMTVQQCRYSRAAHFGYVVSVSFIYAAFPFSLGTAISYWFPVYTDPSQSWMYRTTLIGMFYLISGIMNYLLRMIACNAVPQNSAVALIFGWCIFEDTVGDLAFTEVGPTSVMFWIAAALLIAKTIVRDLDFASDILTSVQTHCLAAIYPNVDGSEPTNEIKDNVQQRMRQWRLSYDRLVLRHQNYLAECSSKIVVITALIFDTTIIGNHKLLDASIPWLAAYTPLRTFEERVELISGLFILWLIQSFVHCVIVYFICQSEPYISDYRHTTTAITQRIPEIELLSISNDISNNSQTHNDFDSWIRGFTSRYVDAHWYDYHLFYILCIPTFFYLSLSAIAGSNDANFGPLWGRVTDWHFGQHSY